MAMQIKPLWALGAALLGLAAQAQAQQGAPEDPTLKKTGDSVTEPFDGKDVPDKLLAIQADPYSHAGLRRCAAIIREVEELAAVHDPAVNDMVDKTLAQEERESYEKGQGWSIVVELGKA